MDNKNFNNGTEYSKTFREKTEGGSQSKKKESRYIKLFFIQTIISVMIIGAVIITKYASPNTFISVSSALDGLYQNNVTLSDLSDVINDKILNNEAVSVFFNTGK